MKVKRIRKIVPPKDQIKIYEFTGKKKEKKKILLTAGIHGDEGTSIVALQNLVSDLKKMENNELVGTVKVAPICNPEAYRYKRRESPADNRDLNRIFPGNKEGNISERIAAALWEIAKQSDYVFDLHGCGMECHPYILLHKKEVAMELVGNIPHKVIVKSHGTEGQLFVEALEEGIPAAILELRGGNGLIDPEDQKYAHQLVLNLLKNLGFLPEPGETTQQTFYGNIQDIVAQQNGVFLPQKGAGATVEKKEKIGEIDDQNITSPIRGKIVKIAPLQITFLGESLAGVAPLKQEVLKNEE